MARKCRHCKAELPSVKNSDPVQAKGFCDLGHMARHGMDKARKQRERRERRELRQRKEAVKSRSEHLKEAQAAFNAYVRERDAGLPCISCGRNDNEVKAQAVGGTWDCGHYRSVGACPELRLEPLNAHRQCKQCNRDKSGNVVDYRINLIRRIGQEAVDWLEGPHEPKKYTVAELKEIKAYYRRMTRELKRKAA